MLKISKEATIVLWAIFMKFSLFTDFALLLSSRKYPSALALNKSNTFYLFLPNVTPSQNKRGKCKSTIQNTENKLDWGELKWRRTQN